MKRIAFILAAGLALVLSGSANAHPGHTSCAAFGAASAELGQAHELAPLIRSVVEADPTAIGGVVAYEHLVLYCSS